MAESVLVTGGAGYVGSVLVERLVRDGFEVRILDSMIFGSGGLAAVRDECEIMHGDVTDVDCLVQALRGVDCVLHLAAISNDSSGDLDPEWTTQVNFEATKQLTDLAKENDAVRFIYASSSSVYGIKTEPNVSEDLSLNPLTIYSKTKAWSERYVLAQESSDFAPVCVRSATVCGYSPRQRLDTVVNVFVCDALTKGEITVNGGEQQRPLIHIADLCDYYVHLLRAPVELISGAVFNAGGGNYALMEIAKLVADHLQKNVKITRRPRTAKSRSYHISSELVRAKLGLVPQRTVTDAIADLNAAFEDGLIPDPDDSVYRNIERLKEIAAPKEDAGQWRK